MEKAFDLSTVEMTETARIPLKHPESGMEIGVYAEVYGQDSAKYKDASHRVSDKCAEYSRHHRGKTIPNKDYVALDRQKVITCTKSIGPLAYNSEPIDPTDVAAIFDRWPWIYDQVVEGMTDRAGFIKGL